ncbi:hypothetical protein KIH87_02085 [Paraneptunicella aestuarii]|uniref:hypothetical protein n=1 Tax=Paraneptunicella aestuarii TaxID=2831148 RepID=UPI001E3C6F3E|nr:hypothetical protein [Paraneptunicella aestuarii]UAA39178.1 hypothetical protein KIH87_02085 [Paraneptunicella aestuarii]
MFGHGSGELNTFDITEVGHIERVVVGATTPDRIPEPSESKKQMAFVNRCLSEYPKGRIIGIERSFSVIRIGEHQVVLESVAYHIGFKKVPLWITEEQSRKPQYEIDPDKVEDIVGRFV